MSYLGHSGYVQRLAATTVLVFCMLESACKSKEPPATTDSATSKESAAAKESPSAVDAKNPCTVPSASAPHVAQVLGIGPLEGPTHYPGQTTQRCNYHGPESIIIELDLKAGSYALDSARKQMEQHLGGATTDVAGFGDKAFSHVATSEIAKDKKLVMNSLGVQKGKTLVFMSSTAPFEKIRALEADLLRDLGAM